MKPYRIHIPNGNTHALCGLAYVQRKNVLPTVTHGDPGKATCINCLGAYYERKGKPK